MDSERSRHGREYLFTVSDIAGHPRSLGAFRDKVLLMVNAVGQCGLTPRYKGLEDLYRRYKDRGFEVSAFRFDQFADLAVYSRIES
ncbi:MAG: hypothetical protein JXA30_17730 [Deltaproteobacteria bacterium]|nr:hypothetical protein [Deltaproteobacteria bacterium]